LVTEYFTLPALAATEVEPDIAPGSCATAKSVLNLGELEPQELFAVTLKFPEVVNAELTFFIPTEVPVFETMLNPAGGVHVYDVAPETELILKLKVLGPQIFIVGPLIVPGCDGLVLVPFEIVIVLVFTHPLASVTV
jgi:hypothetical protein